METETYTNSSHLGRKIERIRRLRGMTQTDLGELLGVTKQAISKMEQAEKIDDEKLKQVATALGVTHVENLNHFSMDQAVKLFEELLKIERDKYDKGKEESAK